MTSHNTPPAELNVAHPYYDTFNAMPGTDPLLHLHAGEQPPIPEAGHLLRVAVRPNGDFALDAYPFAHREEIGFELRRTDGNFIARIARTVEAGVLVGESFSPGNSDPERWTSATLSDGRELHGCNPPLQVLAANVNLAREAGRRTLVTSGIVSNHPAEFKVSIRHIGELLRLTVRDTEQTLECVQGQVRGFWLEHLDRLP